MTIEIHELDITEGLNRELYNRLVKKCNELEKKLDIATKALVDILVENPHEGDDDYWDQDKAQQALKEMEEVNK